MRGCMFSAPRRRRARRELLLGLGAQPLPVGEELLVEQREQQVLGIDLGVPAPARQLLRGRDGLLALDRQLVEIHRLLTVSSIVRDMVRHSGCDVPGTSTAAVAGGCGGR